MSMERQKTEQAFHDITAAWEYDDETVVQMASGHAVIDRALGELFGQGYDQASIQLCMDELEKLVAGEFGLAPEHSEKVFRSWADRQPDHIQEAYHGRD